MPRNEASRNEFANLHSLMEYITGHKTGHNTEIYKLPIDELNNKNCVKCYLKFILRLLSTNPLQILRSDKTLRPILISLINFGLLPE